MDTWFVDGLMRPDLTESGNSLQAPWGPTWSVGGRDGSWRCGCSLPGLQAGGESPRTRVHSPSSRLSKVKTPLLILDAHFGVSPLE